MLDLLIFSSSNFDKYCWIMTDIGKKCHILPMHFTGVSLLFYIISTEIWEVFLIVLKVIQVALDCFMGDSRLLKIVSSVLYLLFFVFLIKFWIVCLGYFIWYFSYVSRWLQGLFISVTKVVVSRVNWMMFPGFFKMVSMT